MKKLNLSNVNAGGGFNAPKAGGYVCGVVDIIEKEEDSSEKSDSPKKPSDRLSRPILSALENYAPKA